MDNRPSSSLREPLLDPELVENSNYVVSCNPPRSVGSEGSMGLEDILRAWHDQHQDSVAVQQHDDDNDLGPDEAELHRSERSCRLPWYKNPLQIMAMISNFSTSFNVVNISLVLPILKVVLKEIHPVNPEDEVSVCKIHLVYYSVMALCHGYECKSASSSM